MENLTNGLDPTTVGIAMMLSMLLTWIAGKLGEKIDPRIRSLLPAVAVGLAVGGAALVETLAGADGGVTLRTVWEGAVAGLMAVWAWSQTAQIGKVIKGEKTMKTGGVGKIPPISIVIACLLLAGALTGCAGGGEVTVGDLIPSAQISREGGCLQVVVDQPVPAPDGWEAATRVTVRQKPDRGCGEPEGGVDSGVEP